MKCAFYSCVWTGRLADACGNVQLSHVGQLALCLEKACWNAIRLPTSDLLERGIEDLLTRPPRPAQLRAAGPRQCRASPRGSFPSGGPTTDGDIVKPGSLRPPVFIGAVLGVAAAVGLGLAWSRGVLTALTLDDAPRIAAVIIFIATYVVIAIGQLPRFQLDRTGAALLGATLMVACGAISLGDAYQAIDFDTITLLLGMMIVVANLRLSGFFRLINSWAVTRAHHPIILLGAVVLVTGVLSACLVNDAICLVMAPLIIELTWALKRNPVPYLIGIALASNVGSTATITGNPQNMIIGTLSHIPYGSFAAALAPVAAIGLVLTIVLVALLNPREYWTRERLGEPTLASHYHG